MRNPKCPNCNEEILWNENIDVSVDVDEIYGKLFRVGGFSNDEVLTSYGKTKKYIAI